VVQRVTIVNSIKDTDVFVVLINEYDPNLYKNDHISTVIFFELIKPFIC